MSNQDNMTAQRTTNSFASRLLAKAISERKKTGEITPEITTADAAKYAVERQEIQEPVAVVKS